MLTCSKNEMFFEMTDGIFMFNQKHFQLTYLSANVLQDLVLKGAKVHVW